MRLRPFLRLLGIGQRRPVLTTEGNMEFVMKIRRDRQELRRETNSGAVAGSPDRADQETKLPQP